VLWAGDLKRSPVLFLNKKIGMEVIMPVTKLCLGIGATIIAIGVMAPGALKAAKDAAAAIIAIAVIGLPLVVMEQVFKR